jgi:hypothetical protein
MKHRRFFESERNWKSVAEDNFYQEKFSIPMWTNSREAQPKGELELTRVTLRKMLGKDSGVKERSTRSFR